MTKEDSARILEGKQDYLAHYGIKGQKWGERRFQNEDGSLTEAGRKRYGIEKMSTEALRDAIVRKRLENRLAELKKGNRSNKKETLDLINDIATSIDLTSTLLNNTVLDSSKNTIEKYRDKNRETNSFYDKKILEKMNKIKEIKKEDPEFPTRHIEDDIAKLRDLKTENLKNIKEAETASKSIDLIKNIGKQSTQTLKNVATQVVENAERVKDVANKYNFAKDVDYKKMDTKMLRDYVERVSLEEEYNKLTKPQKMSAVEKGREAFQIILPILSLGVGITALLTNIKQLKMLHADVDITKEVEDMTYEENGRDFIVHMDDYLAHYGVQGQKRGVRRYQNEDGSLTPEGYRHYGIDPNTGRGQNVVTSKQIGQYRKDIYKDSYRKAREEGYNRQQSKAQAISNRALESVKAYGAGRLAERNARIAKAEVKGGLAGIGLGMVGGGAIGSKIDKDGGETGINIGMFLGSAAGGIAGSMLGGELAKRFGKYENKNIQAVDEIDKILINTREMTRDEAIDAVEKYVKKTADEYSNKYMDLLDKNYMVNEKSEDAKRLRKEYQYVLNTVGEAFGTNYLLYLARTVSDEFDKKKKERMKEEMSGIKR